MPDTFRRKGRARDSAYPDADNGKFNWKLAPGSAGEKINRPPKATANCWLIWSPKPIVLLGESVEICQ